MSPISQEKEATQRRFAPHLNPMRWDSVTALASLIHVRRRLRDPVADLMLDSSEKSKGPEAGCSSLEQSEIYSLGS